MKMKHVCEEGSEAEVGIIINPKSDRWELYHPEGREEIFFCPYCGYKLKPEFEHWLEDVGIPTLKIEIKEYEEEGLKAGLIGICEMIADGAKKK